MSVNRLRATAVISAVLIATVIWILSAYGAVSAGDKAPDFSLGSVTGKTTIKLSSYTKKPTLLVFWASWCPHCQHELPAIQKLYNQYKSKGLNVVGVSADQDQKDAAGLINDKKITFPNAFAGTDKGKKVIDDYGVKEVPTIYVLEKGGKIKAVRSGEISADTLRKEIAGIGIK